MGVRILENQREGMAVLYDSVSETAFGPIFRDWDPDGQSMTAFAGEVAEAFLSYLSEDARTYDAAVLMDEYGHFRDLIERDGWEAVTTERTEA